MPRARRCARQALPHHGERVLGEPVHTAAAVATAVAATVATSAVAAFVAAAAVAAFVAAAAVAAAAAATATVAAIASAECATSNNLLEFLYAVQHTFVYVHVQWVS